MRNRYLPRSAPGILPQVFSNARRAAATALSTSPGVAVAISAIFFSVAGEIVVNDEPEPSTKSPSMKSPYDFFRCRMLVDSGAGA